MITQERKKQAKNNFDRYLEEGIIKKEKNLIAKEMYMKNAELSLQVAGELAQSSLRPHLWTIVASYYAMFYMANAALLHFGYKTQDKIVHKVTADALIVLVLDKLKKELLEEYEKAQEEALEIASVKAEEVVQGYELELQKRSQFQYNMLEQTKETKAQTSLKRAREFVFEIKKLIS
ncbi:hypothetical protein HZC31_02025 [Candidatus Woesearchaeota archaeon]|nr:hypothetical protein [Candidatus Woesearchaeota archaeon]